LGGSFAPNPFAFFQTLPKTDGEYYRPLSTKATIVATRIAQMFIV